MIARPNRHEVKGEKCSTCLHALSSHVVVVGEKTIESSRCDYCNCKEFGIA